MRLSSVVDKAIKEYRALQRPEELLWLLKKCKGIQTKLAVELGVCNGGTYFALQTIFDRVIGIDTGKRIFPFSLRSVDLNITGNSRDPKIIEKIPSDIDFLLIDADHSYEGVSEDYKLWKDKVRKGGIIAFHDISGAVGEDGVKRFWTENKSKFGRIDEIKSHPNLFGIGILWND